MAPTTDTVPALAADLAAADPRRVALIAGGEQLRLGDWVSRARTIAGGLMKLGVRRGDRVGLLVGDSDWVDWAVADMGVQFAGGTAVGLAGSLPPSEIARRAIRCGLVGLVYTTATATAAGSATAGAAGGGRWWTAPLRTLHGTAGPAGTPEPEPDDLAEILHTSGTTGSAKAVGVSHTNLTFGRGTIRTTLFGRAAGILAAVAPATNAGHSALLLALTGASTVFVPVDRDPVALAALAESARVGWVILPPAAATAWAAGRIGDATDLSTVDTVMLGSGAVAAAVAARLSRLLPGAALVIGYGATEAAPASTQLVVTPGTAEMPPAGSVGRPGPGVVASVAGPRGGVLRRGRVGRIRLRSPAPRRCYVADPDADSRTYAGGWAYPGDLGHLDENGDLHVFDRVSDVIVTAAGLVSSIRVADALHWHPEVVDAAAVGVPHPERGQAVLAAVELRSPVPEAELLAFAAERLEEHERPDTVVVGRLPRGEGGKHAKRDIREWVGGRVASGWARESSAPGAASPPRAPAPPR